MAVTIGFETHSSSEDNDNGIASGWDQGRLSPYPDGESWSGAVQRVGWEYQTATSL